MNRHFPVVPLGEALQLRIDAVPVDPSISYMMAGVYSFGRGLFKRGPLSGTETTYKFLHRLHKDHFVISQPKAWEGALARVPMEFDGLFLSSVFPTFRALPDCLDVRYLEWYCKQARVWEELRSKARGMGARRESVLPNQFLSLTIPLPTLSEQRRIVAKIGELAARIQEALILSQQTMQEAEALIASKLRSVVIECGNNVRYLPFTEIAKLERRPVSVKIDQQYQEIGVYSFGKGIFHKLPRTGAEVGDKDLYEIRAGDLILQITFAWEGAVALAEPKDDRLYGSVRYLTFRVNDEICSSRYLLTYLKTPEGISELGKISPGSAGRNRVLSVKRLNEVIVPVVPGGFQKWLTDELNSKIESLMTLQVETMTKLNLLLSSILDKAFKGEL